MSLVRLTVLLSVLLGTAQARVFASPPMHALVIGNGDYPTAPLKNPVNDSRLITDVLDSAGFQVTRLENLDNKQMNEAIADFQHAIPQCSVALIYYAGHGAQDANGTSYVIPIDATLGTSAALRYQSISVNYLKDVLQESPSSLNILILDCCRDAVFNTVRAFRSAANAGGSAPKGSVVVYSTSAGKNAIDGTGEHSPFAHHLAKSIQEGTQERLSLMQVLQMTGRRVAAEIDQTPGVEVDLTLPEFHFTSRTANKPNSELATAPTVYSAPVASNKILSHAPVASSRPTPSPASSNPSSNQSNAIMLQADGYLAAGDFDQAISHYTRIIESNLASPSELRRATRARSQAFLSRRQDSNDLIAATEDIQAIGELGFVIPAPEFGGELQVVNRKSQRVNKSDHLLITKVDATHAWMWVASVNQDSTRSGWIKANELVARKQVANEQVANEQVANQKQVPNHQVVSTVSNRIESQTVQANVTVQHPGINSTTTNFPPQSSTTLVEQQVFLPTTLDSTQGQPMSQSRSFNTQSAPQQQWLNQATAPPVVPSQSNQPTSGRGAWKSWGGLGCKGCSIGKKR